MQTWASVDVPRLAGGGPPLRLYDTATGEVRPTAPGATATMYVCGITPYDATHLGHAATYLAFDLVHRVWLDIGHDVHYVQNVTDIDDPLLERAARDQDDWVVLGMRETALFREDMEALRVLPPRDYIGAVEAIREIAELVGKLLAAGAAYRVDDPEYPDVYFDSTRHRPLRLRVELRRGHDDRAVPPSAAATRTGPASGTRLDALLWRDGAAGRAVLGVRPGRRAVPAGTSSARRSRSTGSAPQIDVQGGGSDLIFPHHEFGAAHAEAFTGVHPFARHYVHAGMIGLDGEKMSKSRGNLVFVSKLRAEGVDPNAIRLALLAGHYRTDRAWTADAARRRAEQRLARWREAVRSARRPARRRPGGAAAHPPRRRPRHARRPRRRRRVGRRRRWSATAAIRRPRRSRATRWTRSSEWRSNSSLTHQLWCSYRNCSCCAGTTVGVRAVGQSGGSIVPASGSTSSSAGTLPGWSSPPSSSGSSTSTSGTPGGRGGSGSGCGSVMRAGYPFWLGEAHGAATCWAVSCRPAAPTR